MSAADLVELLLHAKAAVIEQPPTSGFLIRLVEFNLAGVPIFVSGKYLQSKRMEDYGIFSVSKLEDILSTQTLQSFKKFSFPEEESSQLLQSLLV